MLSALLSYAGQADAFEAGLFRWERRNYVPLPVRVWYGPPADPLTGSLLDRSWRWQFEFGGFLLDAYAKVVGYDAEEILSAFWPKAKANRIDRAEYDYLLDTAAHAREHDPKSPFASARGRVDLLSASIIIPGE